MIAKEQIFFPLGSGVRGVGEKVRLKGASRESASTVAFTRQSWDESVSLLGVMGPSSAVVAP